jgi:DNA-binding MarR family transcriptional regulator
MGPHASFAVDLRSALDAFRQIVQVLRQAAHESETRVGLTSAQLFALQQLAAYPGASINDLAARTFTHQSSVSVVVGRLVERRLVAKSASETDRRRVTLQLTEAGRRLLKRSPEPAQERLIAGLAALDERSRRSLAASLSVVASTMTDGSGPPPMLFEDRVRRSRRTPASSGPGRARRRGRTRAATRPA